MEGQLRRSKGQGTTCLSYWFPIIEAAGLPVPKTVIIESPDGLIGCLDDRKPEGWEGFIRELGDTADAMGYPCFLRTGQGSGKHQWRDTCYVERRDVLGQHVYNLIEWSVLAGPIGLPTDVWVVREMLPVEVLAYLREYGGMPLVREVRGFIRDGEVICQHPYWPKGAIVRGGGSESLYKAASSLTVVEDAAVEELLWRVGQAIPGAWSVDVLDTKRGWYITDMAEAERSWHWPDCSEAGGLRA